MWGSDKGAGAIIAKRCQRLFVLILVCFAAASSFAVDGIAAENQDIPQETLARVSDYVREQLERNQVIGGALGIVHRDKLISSEGFGAADRERNDTPTEKTVYFAASITKALTATAVWQLHEQGKLDIGKPVQTYIPWFEFENSDLSSKVTLKHLLTHSAGGIGSWETDGLVFAHRDAKDSLESYVRQFRKVRLSEEPGQSGHRLHRADRAQRSFHGTFSSESTVQTNGTPKACPGSSSPCSAGGRPRFLSGF